MSIFKRNHESSGNGHNIIPLALHLTSPRPPTGPSDGSNGALPRPIMEFGDEIWDLGWTDGRLGQPLPEYERVFQVHAELTKRHKIKTLEGEIAGLTNEVEREQRLKEASDKAFTSAVTRLDEVKERRSKKLREYSLVLGLMLLGVGFILFLSDIPLSLRLVAQGYKIPTEASLPNGDTVVIGDIFTKPGLVLQHLWEPLLLALGLAFSGIFVKIFIDEVIWIRQQSEENPRKVRVFFYSVAVLFVLTLAFVGAFRATQQAQGTTAAAVPSYVPSFATGGASPAPSATANPSGAGSTWGTGFWSFLLITLMLPIVGGICFLAGWSCIQHWFYLQSCRLDVFLSSWQYKSASRVLTSAREHLEAAQSQLRLLTAGSNLQADLWESLYRHGYWRGMAVPETLEAQEDLYTRCERYLTKQLAARARKEFWKQTPQGGTHVS